ncbi:MAG: thiol oxidoreductase [Bacteroidetes bacterium]|nr:MAG: thiol oxidoreductase [Bacteroidota bacterium]
MKRVNYLLSITFMASILLLSCKKIFPTAPEASETLDGPIEGLSPEENKRFLAGDAAFARAFTPATGLGPGFVATSCISCHAGDGKGHPSTSLIRFGQVDGTGNMYLDRGGPQLQNRAIPGFSPEQIPDGAHFSTFLPPANAGLGYLDFVSDADILALADPTDANGDGISGVPNWIDLPAFLNPRPGSVSQNGKYIGRFGKKAAAYNLLHQTVNAYNQDMGIVSTYVPIDPYTGNLLDPEVTNQEVEDLVFYLHTLKAPSPRSIENSSRAKQLFEDVQCAACHLPKMKTGDSPIQALSNQTFYPYTDLLLHDMGPGLDDHYTEGQALTSEWRTPPLWGLGLSPIAQGGSYFLMHDGRARSIEEAILYHGGEAQNSRQLYEALPTSDKELIIRFLKSL